MTWRDSLEVSIATVCEVLDLGRTTVFELIESGRLEAVGAGKNRRVTTASVLSYHQDRVDAERRRRGLNDEGPRPR